jgi:transportin-3
VLRSFTEWLKLKPGAGLDGAALAQHPLVTAALQGLQSAQTFDASVEALCELIYCTVDSQGPLPGMDPLIQRLVPAVRPHLVSACVTESV